MRNNQTGFWTVMKKIVWTWFKLTSTLKINSWQKKILSNQGFLDLKQIEKLKMTNTTTVTTDRCSMCKKHPKEYFIYICLIIVEFYILPTSSNVSVYFIIIIITRKLVFAVDWCRKYGKLHQKIYTLFKILSSHLQLVITPKPWYSFTLNTKFKIKIILFDHSKYVFALTEHKKTILMLRKHDKRSDREG